MGSFTRAALHCAFAAATCLRAILFPTPRLPECRNRGVNIRAGEVGEHTYHPAAYVDPDGGGYHGPFGSEYGSDAAFEPVVGVGHEGDVWGDEGHVGGPPAAFFRRRLLGVRRVCCPTCLGRRRWPCACRGIGRCRGVRRRRPCCWRFLLLRVRGSGVVFRGLLGC